MSPVRLDHPWVRSTSASTSMLDVPLNYAEIMGSNPPSPTSPIVRANSFKVNPNYTTIDVTMTEALAKVIRERASQDHHAIIFKDMKENLIFT